MGINSVNGREIAALFVSAASERPAPELRRTDAATGNTPSMRAALEKRAEQSTQAARTEAPPPKPVVTHTSFRVDKENNRIVVSILDQNNQVIKQIPPEEILEIASKFRQLQALLFDEQA